MKELAILAILSGFTFLLFLTALILGFKKKSKQFKIIAIILLFSFVSLISWTAYKFVNKSLTAVSEMLEPRTGDEIYDALFDKRQTNCVKILNYQDQVVPKVDYAIWLEFETCPEELRRILSRHEFRSGKIPSNNSEIPYGETLKWFNPNTMDDTISVF